MRHVSKDGLFWLEQVDTENVILGLTKNAINKYGCLHVFIPRMLMGNVAKNQILASIEGSKALAPLVSPVTGKLTGVNTELAETPFNIGPNDMLFQMSGVDWKESFV